MKKLIITIIFLAIVGGVAYGIFASKKGRAIEPVPNPYTMNVQVYFGNIVNDPNLINCQITYPIIREIPQTTTVARAALEQLLQGPSTAEYNTGARTFLGSGISINSLTISNGVASVDFNTLIGPGGTCGVAGMLSQIGNTLGQFSTVNSVVITVNGTPVEDFVQGMI